MKYTGIRFRLLLLGIIPAFILTSALAFYFIDNQIRTLQVSLSERGDMITRQLASASVYGVFSGNNQILQELVNTVLQEKDVVSVKIINQQDVIIAKAQLLEIPDADYLQNFTAAVTLKPLAKSYSDDDPLFYTADEQSTTKNIGRVAIRLSLQNTLANQRTALINSVFITLAGLIITALLAFRLGHKISLPIIKLTQAVNDISMGNLSTRANFYAEDEIEDLREGFNIMAIGLEQTHIYLEKQVGNATDKLRKALKTLEIKNLTLEKSQQLAVAQNEIKSQFLAHISHEIRTPMNGIIGFIDLLLNSDQNPQQIDRLQLIKNSAINLLAIVNEILELSSLESGKFSLNYQSFDLRSCLENAVILFSTHNNKVELILDIDSDVQQRISNDPIRLQQIITNLLSNANKFTQQGHIIIRCRLLKNSTNSAQKSLFISVSDTGIGISQTNLSRLFSPFLQISPFAINREQGTGLGLSISKNIVERMHGKIGAISAENTGSTFWVNLPCTTFKSPFQATKGNNAAIIIADNICRRAFKKQLISLGHQVTSYASISSFSGAVSDDFYVIFIDASFIAQQMLSESSNLYFNENSVPKHKVIILIRNNQYMAFENAEFALSLPCRSSYLSTLIKSHLNMGNTFKTDIHDPAITQLVAQSTILIADDNEINRLLLKAQFENHCQHIDLANNGREAFEYISSSSYDLILLDLQMPELTGMELIKKIKTAQCRNVHTPVIAITAHAQHDQRQKVIAAGFDDCLIKPVLAEQINKVIDTCLLDKLPNSTTRVKSQHTDYVQIMLEKTMNNQGLAKNLFNKLFQELPEQMQIIKVACNEFDTALAKKTVHKLNGSASFCGLFEIQSAAHNLETTLADNDKTKLSLHLEQLEIHIDKFLSEKNIIINKLRA